MRIRRLVGLAMVISAALSLTGGARALFSSTPAQPGMAQTVPVQGVNATRFGPGNGYVPVPNDQGDWLVSGTAPDDVARRFVLGTDQCDCERVSIELVSDALDRLVYLVRLEGLKDDSVNTTEYRVELQQREEQWHVAAAEYHTLCHRGISSDGYCN